MCISHAKKKGIEMTNTVTPKRMRRGDSGPAFGTRDYDSYPNTAFNELHDEDVRMQFGFTRDGITYVRVTSENDGIEYDVPESVLHF